MCHNTCLLFIYYKYIYLLLKFSSFDVQEKHTRLRCLNSLPKPMADILAEMLDLAVLKNRGMMVLAAANVVGMFGFFVPIIFSSSRAVSLGVSNSNAALLLSIIGECELILVSQCRIKLDRV